MERSSSSSFADKSETDPSGSEETEEVNWVEWFCGQPGKQPFVEVDENYINDDFNLTGLQPLIPHFRKALDLILDLVDPDDDDSESNEQQQNELEMSAQLLYGLIHARFLLTNRGLQLMQEKYNQQIYGHCPNTMCNLQPVFPIGISDHPSYHKCKVYCMRCNEVYHPEVFRLAELDGAFFGTSAAHLFFIQNEDFTLQPHPPLDYYRPRIYGFKVHTNVKDKLRELQNNTATRNNQQNQQNNASATAVVPNTAPAVGWTQSTGVPEVNQSANVIPPGVRSNN